MTLLMAHNHLGSSKKLYLDHMQTCSRLCAGAGVHVDTQGLWSRAQRLGEQSNTFSLCSVFTTRTEVMTSFV